MVKSKGNDLDKTELIWLGKYDSVKKSKRIPIEKVSLPFQRVETINSSRQKQKDLSSFSKKDSWKNKLIWGDNKYVLSSLLNKFRGKIKLIYIDPPFFTGTNMSINLKIGDENLTKEPSALEEIGYRNIWESSDKGVSSFLKWMYERLALMKELLSENGSIYVRFDWHYGHYIKIILDEIFGYGNFRNEIIVRRGRSKAGFFKQFKYIQSLGVSYDTLFWYSKKEDTRFEKLWKESSKQQKENGKWHAFYKSTPNRPTMQYELLGKKVSSGQWKWSKERAFKAVENYKTYFLKKKKNETLEEYFFKLNDYLEFIRKNDKTIQYWVPPREQVLADNNWMDIPGYSNTTNYPTENSEHLLERVINLGSKKGDLVADFFSGSGTTIAVAEKLGRKWIGVDIGKFSIHTIRKRLLDMTTKKDRVVVKPFEIMNLGRYERQHWQRKNLGKEQIDYLRFIIELYNGEFIKSFQYIHGKKEDRFIHVGAIDSQVTIEEVKTLISDCKRNNISKIDVLGWEFDIGLNENIKPILEKEKINLRFMRIPKEIMDERAVESGDVEFFELAYFEVDLRNTDDGWVVELKNFIMPNTDKLPDEVKNSIISWKDYIDYWAVDWDYKNDTFHNQWQDFRTKKRRNLRSSSDAKTYIKKGKYKILVKIVDVFGNDTSKVIELKI